MSAMAIESPTAGFVLMMIDRIDSLETKLDAMFERKAQSSIEKRRIQLAIFLATKDKTAQLDVFFPHTCTKIFIQTPMRFYNTVQDDMINISVEGNRPNFTPLTDEHKAAARAITKVKNANAYSFPDGVAVTAAASNFGFQECCDAKVPLLEYFEALICSVNLYVAKVKAAVPDMEVSCVRISKPCLQFTIYSKLEVDRPFQAYFDGSSDDEIE